MFRILFRTPSLQSCVHSNRTTFDSNTRRGARRKKRQGRERGARRIECTVDWKCRFHDRTYLEGHCTRPRSLGHFVVLSGRAGRRARSTAGRACLPLVGEVDRRSGVSPLGTKGGHYGRSGQAASRPGTKEGNL